MSLRLVSKDYFTYFTRDHICSYAHKLYFGNSSEVNRDSTVPYPGFPQNSFIEGGNTRTKADFDNAYMRNRNWKRGRPTYVEMIDPVADGSVGCWSSIMVNPPEGLIVYQKTRGILVIRDLCKEGPESETVLDLKAVLGDCITTSSRNLILRDGQGIRLRLNRGRLFVAGEAHEHVPATPGKVQAATSEQSHWGSWLWGYAHIKRAIVWSKHKANVRYRHWASNEPPPEPPTIRQRVQQSTHTQCAVFSVRAEDRGRLIAKWFETDNFLTIAALNEHYCISEFRLMEQRLEGVIYRKEDESGLDNTSPYEPAHRFTVRKKTEYPSLSTFDIAPDTKGKIFYLGFLPPPDRRPVVEIISIPTKQEDGTWTEPTVLKRVILRTLAKHVESAGVALLRSYWIDFDDGIEVTKDMRAKEGKNWEIGEDIVRLRLRGDFVIDGITPQDECVKLISWYITARPSPKQPSTIQQWRNQENWVDGSLNDPRCTVSPWADGLGIVNLEECYPSPTYYTMSYNPDKILSELPVLPDDVDVDRTTLYPFPSQYWFKDSLSRDAFANSILCSEGDPTQLESALNLAGHADTLEYPPIPGRDDHHFVPPGRHLYATFRVTLETGRPIRSKRIIERALAEYKKVAKKARMEKCEGLSDRIWADYEAARKDGLVENNIERLQAMTLSNEEISEEENEAQKASQNAVLCLPKPGHDIAGLKGVFDWKDKRYLVYGKSGSQPVSFGSRMAANRDKKILDENGEVVTEKIVIVRYD